MLYFTETAEGITVSTTHTKDAQSRWDWTSKSQVNDLAAHLGQARPYPLAFLNAAAAEVVRTTPKPGEQNSKILESPKGTSP